MSATGDAAVGLTIVGSYAAMMLLEARHQGVEYPDKRAWRLRGWGFLLVNAAIGVSLPLIVPVEYLARYRWLDCSDVPALPGALLGYFVLSFFAYWWHRVAHRSPFLWRWFHQMHHAPERVDLGGATIFHPFETAMYIVLTFLAATMVLGLSPWAASLTALIAQLYGFFVHMNVPTPRWIGVFVQRPEAHVLHHRREPTPLNYGDFPLWDIVFGTFENPATFSEDSMGFGSGNDEAYLAMLRGRDVSQVGARPGDDL